MFIDPYTPNWLAQLELRAAGLAAGTTIYLLMDGAFIPNLYRDVRSSLSQGESLILLFESLPCCTNGTRSVSPFLFAYQPLSPEMMQTLAKCSGWPMVSAIETIESLAALSARLGAWCVVTNEQQRFNFRFPDTRRLPTIFDKLTSLQRGQLAGPATRWSFIGRDGNWRELPLTSTCQPPAQDPELDNDQFARLVSDSEADEILDTLGSLASTLGDLHSNNYVLVSDALEIAKKCGLAPDLIKVWCSACLRHGARISQRDGPVLLENWRSERARTPT